jgi:hypothetical protein
MPSAGWRRKAFIDDFGGVDILQRFASSSESLPVTAISRHPELAKDLAGSKSQSTALNQPSKVQPTRALPPLFND